MSMTPRVEQVVRELCSIQDELNRALVEDATNAVSSSAKAVVSLEALRDLKSVVDQMRHFLWFYIQVVTENSEASERTMQLLRQVSKATTLRGNSPLTFLEQMNALSEYALVHFDEDPSGKPN